jgi:hypothetical protein
MPPHSNSQFHPSAGRSSNPGRPSGRKSLDLRRLAPLRASGVLRPRLLPHTGHAEPSNSLVL